MTRQQDALNTLLLLSIESGENAELCQSSSATLALRGRHSRLMDPTARRDDDSNRNVSSKHHR